MKPFKPPSLSFASASYAACRYGGAPPELVQVELDLPPGAAARLEQLFRAARPGSPDDAMRPRYARHEAHVRAVSAEGGYPALTGRRR